MATPQNPPPATAATLPLQPLTAAAFAPYGDVVEAAAAAQSYGINAGTAQRFHDLARIATTAGGGHTLVSIFRARPRPLPLALRLMERHRLGSQLFMPLSAQRFLVVVAAAGAAPQAADLRGFVAGPGQGVNFAPDTWHHPLLALGEGGDFLVIDRGDPAGSEDCEVHQLASAVWVPSDGLC